MNNQILEKSFSKNVAKIFTSSLAASLIMLATLPIITRLYSPSDFGLFQILTAFIMILVPAAALKYEMAIVLARYRKEAKIVTTLAFITLCLMVIIIYIFFKTAGESLFAYINKTELFPYVGIICLAIFFYGVMQIAEYVLLLHQDFNQSAINRVVQVSLSHGSQLAVGLVWPSFLSLFFAQLFGVIAATLLVIKRYKFSLYFCNFKLMYLFARKYKDFPLFNATSVFIHNMSIYLPVFMLAKYFPIEIVGLYTFAIKLLDIPFSLLSRSVAKVYFSTAAEAYRKDKKTLFYMYREVVRKMGIIAIIALVIVVLFAPNLVKIIFGEEWILAGHFMQIMIIWKCLEATNMPISTTLSIIGKQKIALYLRITSLIIKFLAIYFFHQSINQSIIAITVVSSLYYFGYNFSVYYNLEKPSK